MGAQHVAVGDDDVGGDALASAQAHARDPAALLLDALDAVAAADVERASQRLHERVDAAVGVPTPVEHLQVDEGGVDGGHAVGVAADEQRVEGERLAHALVLEVA